MKTNKTHISIRSIALLMALVLVVGIAFVVPSSAASSADVGKLVDYFLSNNYTFTLNANSRFFLASEPTGELLQTVQLAQRQFAADGLPNADQTPMDIVYGDTAMLRAGDIYIRLLDINNAEDAELGKDIGAEGYKIVVENYATVMAEDVDGLLYGLNMLQKHFRNAGTHTIKGFTTYDTPDTKERTVQLDCARKYFTVDYICNFIKEMSWMGYNTLQLHFSEDSGFRMDLWNPDYYIDYNKDGTKYSPVNDFSWICGGHPTTWTHTSDLTGVNYADYVDKDKYLETDEIIRILETCKEYHIDVIPSFDTPSHVDYLTWKYEQNYKSNTNYAFTSTYFKTNGENNTYKAKDVSGCINYSEATGYSVPKWPYYTCIDLDSEHALAFAMELYIDIANFFKEFAGSTKFNIGCDEPNLTNSSIRAKAWSYTKFPAYVNDLYTLLSGKGYSVRMFNDFVNATTLASLNKNIQILYWNSPFNSITGATGSGENYQVNYTNSSGSVVNDTMLTVKDYVDDGRILFNCINQHTYYVLRINDSEGDARSATCHQWEFYGATEESIYNDWTPNNIRKKGVYTDPDENTTVPTAQLAGAYFLTWHDYASINTETEIWNGVTDAALKTKEFYSVRERMWSNTIKMWNHDINSSLNFTAFEAIRDTLGDFPGLKDDTYDDPSYTSDEGTPLPAAVAPVQLADHTKLMAALANKIAKGSYTDDSYAAYENAYNQAVLANNDNRADAEKLGTALTNLQNAEAALVVKTNSITLDKKTTINGTVYSLESTKYYMPVGETTYNMFVPAKEGYKFLRAEGSTFTPAEAGDGSGYLSGSITSDITITLWYENQVDVSRLNNLLADAITDQYLDPDTQQIKYTDLSWRVYSTALANAQNFELTINTQQATVLALVKALEDARTSLVVESNTTFIKVEKLANSFNKGGQVGLYIYTSSNVPNLVITQGSDVVTPDSITGEVQTLTTGETVKYWLVFLPADAVGTFTYNVSYGATSTSIEVDVA